MIILAHRGFWLQAGEKNTRASFIRSFENRFGVETDIRDSAEEIFISHDMAKGNEMTVDDFFKLYNSYDPVFPLALNVKADGLCKMMADKLLKNKINNYFFFDMSLPDALGYIKEGLKIFCMLLLLAIHIKKLQRGYLPKFLRPHLFWDGIIYSDWYN